MNHPSSHSSPAFQRARQLACIVLAGLPWAAVQAQTHAIQKCRIDGRLVLQSAPCPLEAKPSQAVVGPTLVSASSISAAGTPRKKTLADVLSERDAAERPQAPLRDTRSDGANVLRARMGAV